MIGLLISLSLLQVTPNVTWKSEVKESPSGSQIVLTGDIRKGVDHVYGTVDISSCQGNDCFSPEEFEFDHYLKSSSVPSFGASSSSVRAAAPVAAPAREVVEASPAPAGVAGLAVVSDT